MRNNAPSWYLYTSLYCLALVLPKVGSSHREKGRDGGWTSGHRMLSPERARKRGAGPLVLWVQSPQGATSCSL